MIRIVLFDRLRKYLSLHVEQDIAHGDKGLVLKEQEIVLANQD